jgi:hypothetical protein
MRFSRLFSANLLTNRAESAIFPVIMPLRRQVRD